MAHGLPDVPLPPNIDRPEMWSAESIVQAVRDGFTFLVPFNFANFGEPNAYWIGKTQYGAMAFTVGPDHSPDIHLEKKGKDDWIATTAYFRPEMVNREAWLAQPHNGVVPVKLLIDPDTINFKSLNAGHQIRMPKGLIGSTDPGRVGRATFLNAPEDMKWLRETALLRAMKQFRGAIYKSAVIYGNEDSPTRIELYRKKSPLVTDQPVILLLDRMTDRYAL